MKLQLLRNATLKLEIGGRIVLIDPFFAPKGSRPSFTGRALNPLVELPASPEEILDGVELVVVSHLHADHFDPVAQSLVPNIFHWSASRATRTRSARSASTTSCRSPRS